MSDIFLAIIALAAILQMFIMMNIYMHLHNMPHHESFLLEQFEQIRERMSHASQTRFAVPPISHQEEETEDQMYTGGE